MTPPRAFRHGELFTIDGSAAVSREALTSRSNLFQTEGHWIIFTPDLIGHTLRLVFQTQSRSTNCSRSLAQPVGQKPSKRNYF